MHISKRKKNSLHVWQQAINWYLHGPYVSFQCHISRYLDSGVDENIIKMALKTSNNLWLCLASNDTEGWGAKEVRWKRRAWKAIKLLLELDAYCAMSFLITYWLDKRACSSEKRLRSETYQVLEYRSGQAHHLNTITPTQNRTGSVKNGKMHF